MTFEMMNNSQLREFPCCLVHFRSKILVSHNRGVAGGSSLAITDLS